MIFSENRCPARIKSGPSFFGIMLKRRARRRRIREAVRARSAERHLTVRVDSEWLSAAHRRAAQVEFAR